MGKPEALFARSFSARYAARTVLAIGAHPDDLELGVGGTLARLAREGAHVVMAVASIPGDFATRRREAEAAAALLGCELRILLDGGARRIEDLKSYELVALIDRAVRELSPAALVTHCASEVHRDHVLVHNACLSAQRLGHFDFMTFQPTMCRPMPVPFQARAYFDVTPTIDAKMQAIAAHASQFASRGIDLEIFRDLARLTGRLVGLPYAEGLDIGRMVLD
ncbi:MAG: PIG-L family deacetylase [Betaproteobacteria bacterium]|nr:PIG-L family deacetylase [Betaproteobacteria bacterium]